MIEEFEKAREGIIDGLKYIGRRNGREFTDFEKSLQAALFALEKQIPKKPKLKKKDWGHIRYYEVCPICENVVIYNSHNYCDNCGQRLDWSDEQ